MALKVFGVQAASPAVEVEPAAMKKVMRSNTTHRTNPVVPIIGTYQS